jgi:hypothetical protein
MVETYNKLEDVCAGMHQLYVSVHTNMYQMKKVLNATMIINHNFNQFTKLLLPFS